MALTRLDKAVKAAFPKVRNRFIDELIEMGLVKGPSGKPLKKGEKVDPSGLDFEPVKKAIQQIETRSPDWQMPVIFSNSDFWVVDKPDGIASTLLSIKDEKTIVNWALHQPEKISNNFEEYPPDPAPHRLDIGTSGILVIAKNAKAFEDWREAFSKKKVRKKYLAWCWGNPSQDNFESNLSVAHDRANPARMVLPSREPDFRAPVLEAQTVFHVIERREGVFLVESDCYTGVTHQVRIHLAGLGYPLVGDELYDSLYDKRSQRLSNHRLRAVSLQSPWGDFEAPSKEFRQSPFVV